MEDLGHPITEQTMEIHILNNLDTNYDREDKLIVHRIHQMKEGNKGKEMSVDDVGIDLNLLY
jgi:hypothetical protein